MISLLNRSHSATAAPTCGPFPQNRTAPGPFAELPARALGGSRGLLPDIGGLPGCPCPENQGKSQSQELVWVGDSDQNKASPGSGLSTVAWRGPGAGSLAQGRVGRNWQVGASPRPKASSTYFSGRAGVGGKKKGSLLSHRGTPNVVKTTTQNLELLSFRSPVSSELQGFPGSRSQQVEKRRFYSPHRSRDIRM